MSLMSVIQPKTLTRRGARLYKKNPPRTEAVVYPEGSNLLSLLQPDAVVAPFTPVIPQVMALLDMEFGLDHLLDLPLGFLLRNRLPVLRHAEPPIRRVQLLRSNLAHRLRNHLAFNEGAHGIAFQQKGLDPLGLFFGARYLTAVCDQLAGAFDRPVQDPRSFFPYQQLIEVRDFLLDRLAAVLDPEHTPIPCRIIRVNING